MSDFTLVCGSDEFAVRSKSIEILTALCGQHPENNPNLELIHGDPDSQAYRHDSGKPKTAEILNKVVEALNTPAFFGDSKVVCLKRFDFSQVGKSKAAKSALNSLVEILKDDFPPDVKLLIDGTGIDRRSAFFKTFQESGQCFFFEKTDVGKRDWEKTIRVRIMEFCRDHRLSLSPDAAAFLADTCGTDSGRIVGELQKLMAYLHPNTNITLEDCRAICSVTPEAAAWAFADELGKKNLNGALKVLNTMIGNQTKHTSLVGMASNRFQEMVKVRTAARRLSIPDNATQRQFMSRVENIPPRLKEELAGHLILRAHPFKVWMVFSQSLKFSDAKLADILTSIMRVNRQLVSGGADSRIALELLAMEICG
ncbi:MAG: DNA polymerase III subunit delta [Kiritimatiellaeota bacterium]|nr:DNA polymerase III subunit delta [Kiritimatiellota bacterium]